MQCPKLADRLPLGKTYNKRGGGQEVNNGFKTVVLPSGTRNSRVQRSEENESLTGKKFKPFTWIIKGIQEQWILLQPSTQWTVLTGALSWYKCEGCHV